MSSTFYTNTIWYILLAIIALVELIVVMLKAKRRKLTFAFFLTILGITLSLETIILIFLKSYEYYPMIFKESPNPFDDIIAGNIFSQFSVSVSVLLAVVLNLNYYWYFIIAAIYGIIEELFIALGIYKHNWYRTWMTVSMFPLAIWMTKKMYSKIIRGARPIFYYGYIFLGLYSLYTIIILWAFQLIGYLDFNTTIFTDPTNSRYFLALVTFFIPPSVLMMLIYFLRSKLYWKVFAVATLYMFYYTCYKLNLIWFKEGWFLIISTVTIIWMYLSLILLDRLYGGRM